MKLKILKPVDIDVQYLDVHFGDRVYAEDFQLEGKNYNTLTDIFNEYPFFKDTNNLMYIRINVDTGEVINWPIGIKGNFTSVKVVDEGVYELYDFNKNLIHTHEYCYVPSCLQIEESGYGDYTEFIVNEDGHIKNWKFTQAHFNELMDIDNDNE